MKNKKVIIIVVIILALCCCAVAVIGGLYFLANRGITTAQSTLNDNIRKDFLNNVNLQVNAFYATRGKYPNELAFAIYKNYVNLDGEKISIDDTSADLLHDFCYTVNTKSDEYAMAIRYQDGSLFKQQNGALSCLPR